MIFLYAFFLKSESIIFTINFIIKMDNKSIDITLFYCSNSIHQNDFSQVSKDIPEINFKMISLPCSGKVDLLYLLKAIETGADGVIIVTCMIGDCHYLEGNLRANKRVMAVNSILKETGIDFDRIFLIRPENKDDYGYLIKEIKSFCSSIKKLPEKGSVIA
jgi:coenzyme F420-reducing hydrogenase delta subunit